ncbi:TRAP transporter large permease [Egibacter rhizosphaerae]|uniref:TRAP transporter large permease n=1 Tax=Egibacter rhizosphaerae TaxID=1670831 RepID=A0A411YGL9_9ACTN|nr:TRAP transporter large permease [Egibacter rhizosphaerae]QBI20404.1 TRAP transporter large permease [Egibacter rhizosphaerae]
MSDLAIAGIGVVAMLALMLLRMPVAFAMMIVGFVGAMVVLTPDAALQLISADVWNQLSAFSLSVIPMFVLMGQVAYRSGITQRLYETAYNWLGHLPGGVAATTILASMGFAMVSGSNTATTATMGTVALPEMRRYGYARSLASSSVAMGGTLGVVIPPSVVLIVIAIQAELSIGRLFVAAIAPGIMLTIMLLLTVVVLCRLRPELGPPSEKASWGQRLGSLGGVIETLVLFALVIGGLYLGWFTPTESGAIGAFGAFVIGFARRNLNWEQIKLATLETLRISAMVILLLAGAVVISRFLTVTRLPFELAEWAADVAVDPLWMLLMVLLIYLIGGLIMDALGFLVATIPIFFPLALALDFNPIWFTLLITLVTSLGAVTPPVGVNVYIVSSLDPDLGVVEVFRGVLPFMLSYVLVIALLIAFPGIALFAL